MLLVVAAVALGLVSMRLGRSANDVEEHATVAQLAVVTVSGGDRPGLDEALWLYGVPIARPTEYATIVPIPEPTVRLQRPEVSVPEVAERGTSVNWRLLVEQYGDWPVNVMLRINYCESGGNPNAINYYNADGLFDYGGWQLHGDPRGLDPVLGTEIAHEKYEASGLQPWVSSRRCWA